MYLKELVETNFPIEIIREGLKYALEPIGIKVDTSDNPLLYVEGETNPGGYSEYSPGRRKRSRSNHIGGKRQRVTRKREKR